MVSRETGGLRGDYYGVRSHSVYSCRADAFLRDRTVVRAGGSRRLERCAVTLPRPSRTASQDPADPAPAGGGAGRRPRPARPPAAACAQRGESCRGRPVGGTDRAVGTQDRRCPGLHRQRPVGGRCGPAARERVRVGRVEPRAAVRQCRLRRPPPRGRPRRGDPGRCARHRRLRRRDRARQQARHRQQRRPAGAREAVRHRLEHRPPSRLRPGRRRRDHGQRAVPRLQDHQPARRGEHPADLRADVVRHLSAAARPASRRARRGRAASVPRRDDEPGGAALLRRRDAHDVAAPLLRRQGLVRQELHRRRDRRSAALPPLAARAGERVAGQPSPPPHRGDLLAVVAGLGRGARPRLAGPDRATGRRRLRHRPPGPGRASSR